jgi:hypothetical protein
VRWMSIICNYSADQRVFFNENACCGHTINGCWECSLQNFLCRARRIDTKSKRYNILPALLKKEYISVDIFQDSYNTARFKFFVSCNVFSKTNSWSQSLSVLIVDNASIYNYEVNARFRDFLSLRTDLILIGLSNARRSF